MKKYTKSQNIKHVTKGTKFNHKEHKTYEQTLKRSQTKESKTCYDMTKTSHLYEKNRNTPKGKP